MGSEKKGKPLTVTLELSESLRIEIAQRGKLFRLTDAQVVAEMVEYAADRSGLTEEAAAAKREEPMRAFEAFAESGSKFSNRWPPGYTPDDSRESIYEGRGE